MTHWHLSVPATSANLGPGFDMLGLALDLRLELRAEPSPVVRLSLFGYGQEDLPQGEDNLLWTAYQFACERNRWPITKLALEIHNPIPIGSGLGSSAAVIVIGLALAREVHGQAWDREQMLREAIEIEGHPDNVAPALLGGLICCERNEMGFLPQRRPISAAIRVVTATPDERSNTRAMREILPNPQPQALLISHREMAYTLLEGLAHGKPEGLRLSCEDELHQPHRLALLPKAHDIFQIFRNHSELHGAYLSGSGPTIAGWVLGPQNPSGALDAQLKANQIKADLRFLRLDQDGARREGTHVLLQPA